MNLQELYGKLKVDREEWVERAVRNAVLTIPALFPREGVHRHQLPQNFQSVGAKGVNMLTSKLLLTLFPPTLPFMRLVVTESDRQAYFQSQGIGGAEQKNANSELDQSLTRIEQQAVSKFDQNGWRPAVAEAMRLLVCTGNALIYDRPGGRPGTYNLHRFVVERDSDGTLQAVVLKQRLTRESAILQLGPEIVEAIDTIKKDTKATDLFTEDYDVYTGAVLQDDGKFDFWEEVDGVMVPGSRRTVKKDDLPLIPLRFGAEPCSSYGRSYVEDYDGSLLSLEKISRSLTEAALSGSKVIWLVKPNAMTKPQTLAQAPNMAIRAGDPEDVGVVRADKGSDFAFAVGIRDRIVAELEGSFLLNRSIQRSGERVTAEEIRLLSQELEDALGGVYTSLADTVQAPVVFYLFNKMKRDKEIQLPPEVKPAIATGLEAISRNHMVGRIHQMFATMQQIVGPDRVGEIINVSAVASDLATGYNLDAARYVLSDEEIQARQQAMQQQALMEQAAGPAIKAATEQAQ